MEYPSDLHETAFKHYNHIVKSRECVNFMEDYVHYSKYTQIFQNETPFPFADTLFHFEKYSKRDIVSLC